MSRHHDLDELNDLSSLELGILEKRIKLVSGRDLVELLGVRELVGRGSRGEEVEEEGVVVGLDVVVDGVNPVDLGDEEGSKEEGEHRARQEKERSRETTYLSLDFVTVVVENENEGSKTSARREKEKRAGKESVGARRDEKRRATKTHRRIMVPIS